LQDDISAWHKENTTFDAAKYKNFLTDIGYLEEEVEDFKVDLENVDDEIARMGGPQLVVPINNPRYAINAVNSRWGSLYDALYGSNIISEANGADKGNSYNPVRGDIVIEQSREFLDESVPLTKGSHKEATLYKVENGNLSVELENGEVVGLKNADQFIGFQGEEEAPDRKSTRLNSSHVSISYAV